jgi:uncharacterized protein (TIGR02231 family)
MTPVAMAAGPMPMKMGKPKDESTDLMMGALEEESIAPDGPAEEAEFTQASVKELPLAFEYDLPQPVNMDSGEDETLLPLFTQELDGKFFIYAAPRMDSHTYLVCSTKPNLALLAGKLNIHFGGRFMGGTTLSEKKAGEDLLINLGVERGVKVSHEKVTDKVTESFFGVVDRMSKARELRFRITVENMKDEPVNVHLLDTIPVSKTDKIQVKGLETKPNPTRENYLEHEGVMLWDLKLDPKSIHKISIKFYVKHPKEWQLEGL